MPQNSGSSVLDYIYRKGREGAKAFFDKITNRKNRNLTSKTDTDPLIDWVEQTGREDAVDFLRQKGLDKSGIIKETLESTKLDNLDAQAEENLKVTPSKEKPFVNNPFDDEGNLKPNVKYKTGEFDYIYETDEYGRICFWYTDNLQLTKRKYRLRHYKNTPGKIKGDHAGHLAGDRFGGSPGKDNLVSQSANVNLSEYKKIENEWANAIKQGEKVTTNVYIQYEGNSSRPVGFNVEYTINGKNQNKNLKN